MNRDERGYHYNRFEDFSASITRYCAGIVRQHPEITIGAAAGYLPVDFRCSLRDLSLERGSPKSEHPAQLADTEVRAALFSKAAAFLAQLNEGRKPDRAACRVRDYAAGHRKSGRRMCGLTRNCGLRRLC